MPGAHAQTQACHRDRGEARRVGTGYNEVLCVRPGRRKRMYNLLHVSGLAWSGGYQVARKSTDASQSFEQVVGMGLMGFGGLISILGGVIFLYVVYRAMRTTAGRITAEAAS